MTNRLSQSSSPYLLQHQDNPVDWFEWGEEAFAEARRRDVPLLLSVGYAACHWCHVMAHESFEDPETAELMNERFVNIKVDREERPDVDAIYMEAVQAMTGQGGWPMTVWLDHDGRPFFTGTYFPDRPRHGMPSFRQVIEAVSSAWSEKRDEVTDQAQRLVEAISREVPSQQPDPEATTRALTQIAASFDEVHGGFGRAPKFPQQPVLEFLLRMQDGEPEARRMLAHTLHRMADGGIHDQLGGGFARYSVDQAWLIPHFEKMLYDNAQLGRLYLWAGIELKDGRLVGVARSALEYMARDLRHPDGGFYSSEDADSEGVEGKFYVWTPEEIRSVLGDDAEEIIGYFGVTEQGNFEGANVLSIVGDSTPETLDEARENLLTARSRRVRPGLDDKVITSWNGLAIKAFAEAGAALAEQRYLDLAAQAADFVLSNLVVDGRLMRAWREGRVSVPGFLDDHAALALSLFTLYAATSDERWYEEAIDLVQSLDHFAKPGGGFYTTPDDGEELVKRPQDLADNPLPSGNALAAEALLLASLYTGESSWRDKSEQAIDAAGLLIERYPAMVGHHLAVLHSSARTRELAVVGPEWQRLARVHWQRYRPHVALAPSATGTTTVPLLEGRAGGDGARAYVCRGFVCDLPTESATELLAQLEQRVA